MHHSALETMCDILLLSFAFKFNLRHNTLAGPWRRADVRSGDRVPLLIDRYVLLKEGLIRRLLPTRTRRKAAAQS